MAKKKTSKKNKKTHSKFLKKNQLKALTRFLDSEDDFILIKTGSKRADSRVWVSQYEIGSFSLHNYKGVADLPTCYGAFITGRGFSYLRTSPIVKILESTETSTSFETEGGFYKLEKYVPGQLPTL